MCDKSTDNSKWVEGKQVPLPLKKKCIHFFLAMLGLHHFVCFSLVATNGGYCLVVVLRLLFVVASLVEHELQTHRLQ